MPTPDPSNVLFKIAHPDLYERNPFNILNLPVDATAKDIRRRKEDIEAAFDAGTEANEFSNIIPGDVCRNLPTREDVATLFDILEDPERRIAYAMFWFWPDSLASDSTRGKNRSRNPNGAFGHRTVIRNWTEEASLAWGATPTQPIARHNLAVFHHLMGLAYELSLEKYDVRSAETPEDVPKHWNAAIFWWNKVADDPDFWHSVSDLVSLQNDPRLDYKFVRSLKAQFAFAFDQINVELAIDFAKRGRDSDAKRQIEYMKRSQPDADDVEGTCEDAFSGLIRQTEAIVKAATDETRKNPKSGFTQANNILEQTAEPLNIACSIFENGSPIRSTIVSRIFAGVRSCLIAYGNETKDWQNCATWMRQLKDIAETEADLKAIENDVKILTQNHELQLKESQCQLCGRVIPKGQKKVWNWPCHGEVKKGTQYGQVTYRHAQVPIQVCPSCLYQVAQTSPSRFKNELVQELLGKGWKSGLEPTEQEMKSVWGNDDISSGVRMNSDAVLMRTMRPYHSNNDIGGSEENEFKNCIIPLVLLGLGLVYFIWVLVNEL